MRQIYSDKDGVSHLGTVDWPLTDARYCESPDGYSITDAWAADAVRLIRTPAGFVDDWHPVPDRMISVLLNGNLKVDVSDGGTFVLHAGEMVLCDDTYGQGHRMNEVDGAAYDMLLVGMPGRV